VADEDNDTQSGAHGTAREATPDGAADSAGAEDAAGSEERADADGVDLKGIFRQLTAPMIESLDTRLREQVEAHVDELLGAKVDAALADRLSTVDRAIADLSRTLQALEHRVAMLETPEDELP